MPTTFCLSFWGQRGHTAEWTPYKFLTTSELKKKSFQSNGSYPLPPHGWQRSSLRRVSKVPFRMPYLEKAAFA